MRSLLILFFSMILSAGQAQSLTMILGVSDVSGDLVTYDIRAENFNDMVSYQYGIVYDAMALEFVELKSLNLPDLSAGNFNTSVAGEIRALWLDPQLTGLTLAPSDIHYQIVFREVGPTSGNVCFSEDALTIEFVTAELELPSFQIMDDCYSSPHEVSLTTTSTAEVTARYGIRVSTMIGNNAVQLHLDKSLTTAFDVFDMNGKHVQTITKTSYDPGTHNLTLSRSMSSGMYVIHTTINGVPVGLKLIKP